MQSLPGCTIWHWYNSPPPPPQKKKKRVLPIDYAITYQCELRKETMGALWIQEIVNLLRAVYHTSDTETIFFGTDYNGKDIFSTAYFI